MTKRNVVLFLFLLLVAALPAVLPEIALGQSGSSSGTDGQSISPQDSVTGGTLRPRRGTYLIQTFPSPAMGDEVVNVQFYNQNAQEISVRIVDLNDRTVRVLQSRQLTAPGLHRFSNFTSRMLSSGVYYIRLTTFTPTGDIDQVESSPFLIAH